MTHLVLSLLGPPEIQIDHQPVTFPTRKATALLAYLAVTDQPHARDSLATLLWPDLDQRKARASLRHALWMLSFANVGEWLETAQETIGLRSGFALDVAAFQEKLAQSHAHGHSAEEACAACLAWLSEAAALYRGEFLAGFSLRDSAEFDDWQRFQVESLSQKLAEVLERLVGLHSAVGDWEPALTHARRWVSLDPLHEPAQRALMRLYALAGKRGQAMKQYETLRQSLDQELGVEPEEETRQLQADILGGKIQFETLPPPASRPRDNLPIQLTSFIGRDRELAVIKNFLTPPTSGNGKSEDPKKESLQLKTFNLQSLRLFTLTGPGGSGKTRLALRSAEELVEAYPGGAWLVELAALSDPALVPYAAAAVLDVHEQPGGEIVDALTRAVCFRPPFLFLLDNCEHLIAACASLAQQLLSACRNLHILATSRVPLGIPGETIWPVLGLSLPDLGNLSQSEALLEQSDAVRLFVERAEAGLPGFTLTDQNAAAVVQICHRLDGIPLAIELAAARVKLLSVQQIAARLDHAFHLLTRGGETALPRHQTLRATVDWSYGLLSETERLLFRRLAVFACSFTLTAVEAICAGAGLEAEEVLDELSGLVDQSLVQVLEAEPAGEARYQLLEIIRQYSQEKLDGSGELEQLREHFLDYYLNLAEAADGEMRGPEQVSWLRRLEAEYDNLREALGWAVEAQEGGKSERSSGADRGLRLAAALWNFWEIKGYFTEGRGWLERMLARSSAEPSQARAHVLSGAGTMVWHQADLTQAIAYHEEALSNYRQIGDPAGTAFALNNLAVQYLEQATFDRADVLFEESLTLYRELGDSWGLGCVLLNIGWLARNRGDHLRAAKFYEECLIHLRKSADKRLLAILLFNLGELAQDKGDEKGTIARFEEALLVFNELGERTSTYDWILRMKGDIALAQGEIQRSLEIFHERLRLCREIGDKNMLNESLERLARVMQAGGNLQAAVRLLGAAGALRKAIDVPLPLGALPAHNRFVAALRAGLGEAAFQEAWITGRALAVEGLERVVAYALEQDFNE